MIVDHMADCPPERPDLLKPLLALKRYPKVFVKVSHTWSLSRQPYPYPDSQAQVARVYDAFGAQRLMWGTDWPLVEGYCGYGKALAIVRDEMPFLNAEDKMWMLSGTVSRVFGRMNSEHVSIGQGMSSCEGGACPACGSGLETPLA